MGFKYKRERYASLRTRESSPVFPPGTSCELQPLQPRGRWLFHALTYLAVPAWGRVGQTALLCGLPPRGDQGGKPQTGLSSAVCSGSGGGSGQAGLGRVAQGQLAGWGRGVDGGPGRMLGRGGAGVGGLS